MYRANLVPLLPDAKLGTYTTGPGLEDTSLSYVEIRMLCITDWL